MQAFFQHQISTKIVGGTDGYLSEAGAELEGWRGRRAGVIMDSTIARLDLLGSLEPSLHEAGISVKVVFTEVPQDSDVDVVEDVAAFMREAEVDLLIALGGGSVIDTAKATNILLTHGGSLRDYQGAQVLTHPLLPLVVVPTTVGTGSEVTAVAVVVDRQDARKLTLVDDHLAPTLALLDPLVTHSLPASLVATTALDALTHALEAYMDVAHSPFSDAWAVAATRMVRENLLPALASSGFEEPRGALQVASTMAGIAFNHSMVGVVHAMAHALGGVAGVPHGLANGLMLMEGLRCNAEVVSDRIAEIGLASGFVDAASVQGSGEGETAVAVIEAIEAFRDNVLREARLPKTLRDAGVRPEQIPLLVTRAEEDGTMVYNPKFVESGELEQMFRNQMGGTTRGEISE